MTTPRRGNDDGITLVELIIVVIVGAVLLGGVAIMFANGLTSQAQAADRDLATGRATVIANSLQTSIRNADAVKVEPDQHTVRAVVAMPAGGWECRAWALTAGGEMKYKTSASSIALDNVDAWTTLAPGVTGSLASADGPVPFAMSASGRQLSIGLVVAAGDVTVPIHSGVTAQARVEGSGPCW